MKNTESAMPYLIFGSLVALVIILAVAILIQAYTRSKYHKEFKSRKQGQWYYFEMHMTAGEIYHEGDDSLYRNSNRLYFKPETMLTGVSVKHIITQTKGKILVQYWVDLSKYVEGHYNRVDYWIKNILPNLKDK